MNLLVYSSYSGTVQSLWALNGFPPTDFSTVISCVSVLVYHLCVSEVCLVSRA